MLAPGPGAPINIHVSAFSLLKGDRKYGVDVRARISLAICTSLVDLNRRVIATQD